MRDDKHVKMDIKQSLKYQYFYVFFIGVFQQLETVAS